MSDLTPRESELVALGAAMGSNCVPCVEYHIAESRKIGLADSEIHAVIRHADKIRQVPARKTLQAALNLLSSGVANAQDARAEEGCGSSRAVPEAGKVEAGSADQPRDMMIGLMAKMMETCIRRGQSAEGSPSSEKQPTGRTATSQACGCG
jgi:4-carboxymuconolactone decarboxylase